MDKNADKIAKILNAKTTDEQKRLAMNMLSGMDSKQSAMLKEALSDQKKIQELLNSPQAQQIIQKLKGNKNG